MQTFKEIFEAYGADYETTMERFMGSEETYREFLDMLFDDDNLANLGEAIESGNLDMAFEAAHTLKGVAGNMGLKRLYAAVCDMAVSYTHLNGFYHPNTRCWKRKTDRRHWRFSKNIMKIFL